MHHGLKRIVFDRCETCGTDMEVDWYKRVGRSTKSNKSMKTLDWFNIVVECLESVRDD